MDFVALDVETANPRMSSICQIGIARYADGKLVDEFCTLVNPRDEFDDMNVSIHGITPRMVRGQPDFPSVFASICSRIERSVVVCHTAFDRSAVHQAAEKHSLAVPECRWLDSARVARRTWSQYARKGYGLSNLCEMLNYSYTAHDALEDATAAGAVLLAAIEQSGVSLEDWFKRVNSRLPGPDGKIADITPDGNPEGPLYGEVLVFTGALQMPRVAAAEIASRLGCDVNSSVSKKTTLLVVGEQDISKLAGHKMSSKHRKAEELIKQGVPIRILGEDDFVKLSALTQ